MRRSGVSFWSTFMDIFCFVGISAGKSTSSEHICAGKLKLPHLEGRMPLHRLRHLARGLNTDGELGYKNFIKGYDERSCLASASCGASNPSGRLAQKSRRGFKPLSG